MTTTILGIICACTGSVMACSPLMQTWVMRKNQSSRDVSLPALWAFLVNSVAWTSYGLALGNVALIFTNALAGVCLLFAIATARRFRRTVAVSEFPERLSA